MWFLLIPVCLFAQNPRPAWLDDPLKECSSEEICAVGEGPGVNTATANGQKNLLKYFVTSMKSKQEFHKKTFEDSKGGEMLSGHSSSIEEQSEGILAGVIIKKTFKGIDAVSVLVSVSKKKVSQHLIEEIRLIDKKMKEIYQKNNRTGYQKLLEYFDKRKKLNTQYQVIRDQLIPERITYSKILRLKNLKKKEKLFVDWTGDRIPKEFKEYLLAKLSNAQFEISNDKKMMRKMKATVSIQDVFLKVKGFVKKRVQCILIFMKNGNEIQRKEITRETVGRNEKQAIQKAFGEIRKEIEEKWHTYDF